MRGCNTKEWVTDLVRYTTKYEEDLRGGGGGAPPACTYIVDAKRIPCPTTLFHTYHFFNFSQQYKYFGNEKEEVTNRMVTLVNAVDKVIKNNIADHLLQISRKYGSFTVCPIKLKSQ